MPVDVYASNWFLTLFSNDLGFDAVPSIIDLYLHIGTRALLLISLALLEILKPALMSATADEVMVLMSSCQAR